MKNRIIRTAIAAGAGLFLLSSFLLQAQSAEAATRIVYRDGIYEGSGMGYKNNIDLRVTVEGGKIVAIETLYQKESPKFWASAVKMYDWIIEDQNIPVDVVSCCTYSSNGIKAAVRNALKDAVVSVTDDGADEQKTPADEMPVAPTEEETAAEEPTGTQEEPIQEEPTAASPKSSVKKKQTLTVKTVKKTLKAASLKKKQVKVTKAIQVKKSLGKVTCKKIKGSGKITVKTNGTLVVKKGTQKGTYSVTVQVCAAGNKNYKPATKNVKLTIKVK